MTAGSCSPSASPFPSAAAAAAQASDSGVHACAAGQLLTVTAGGIRVEGQDGWSHRNGCNRRGSVPHFQGVCMFGGSGVVVVGWVVVVGRKALCWGGVRAQGQDTVGVIETRVMGFGACCIFKVCRGGGGGGWEWFGQPCFLTQRQSVRACHSLWARACVSGGGGLLCS